MSFANCKSAMPDGLDSECCKRKRSEEEDEDRSSNAVTRIKYAWHVVLASELPPLSDDDIESICSIQEAETVFAYDTEDTSTNKSAISSDNADDSIHEEYDPISLSADENLLVDSSSDTEIQDNKFISVGVTAAIAFEAFDSGLADHSDDSRTSFHSEISFAHYRTCLQCNTINNDPKFRYCHKCYTERKNHLPPRPKGKKRRKKLSMIAASRKRSLKESRDLTAFYSDEMLEEYEITLFDSVAVSNQRRQRYHNIGFKKIDIENALDTRAGSSQRSLTSFQESFDTVDSGISGSQPGTSVFPQTSDRNENEKLSTTRAENRLTEKIIDGTAEHRGSSQESVRSLASTTASVGSRELAGLYSDENESADKISVSAMRTTLIDRTDPEKLKCKICRDAPRNAALVHNRSAHIACCYPCAKKVWRTTKRCPICNRKIVNILRAYFA